jgi:hypothetical protein
MWRVWVGLLGNRSCTTLYITVTSNDVLIQSLFLLSQLCHSNGVEPGRLPCREGAGLWASRHVSKIVCVAAVDCIPVTFGFKFWTPGLSLGMHCWMKSMLACFCLSYRLWTRQCKDVKFSAVWTKSANFLRKSHPLLKRSFKAKENKCLFCLTLIV